MAAIPDRVMTPRTPMGDMESKLGIQPIEELLAERAVLVKRVADLRARYGSGGTWDALRKTQLCQIAALIRAEAVRDSRKMTEAQLDQEAHADPRYVGAITQATKDRVEWAILEDQIQGVNETINRGQVVARFAVAEMHLDQG